jgi:pSer/pThr/pTyr-binding forkhead associated (FHA) protein
MAFQLIMLSGPASGKSYPLNKKEIGIGRDVSNEVFINDAEVSRRHAHLTMQTGTYVIEDTGSTNGTYVNGQRLIGTRLLQPGDTILLGEKVTLSYELVPEDPNATIASAAYPSAEPSPVQAAPVSSSTFTPAPQAYETYIPAEQEVYTPPPAPQPVYTGKPPTPAEAYYEEPERKSSRTWLWVGCGCLLIVLCLLVVGGIFAIDTFDLYCTTPFRSLTVLIGGVCP